jgi:hypothetical protein
MLLKLKELEQKIYVVVDLLIRDVERDGHVFTSAIATLEDGREVVIPESTWKRLPLTFSAPLNLKVEHHIPASEIRQPFTTGTFILTVESRKLPSALQPKSFDSVIDF